MPLITGRLAAENPDTISAVLSRLRKAAPDSHQVSVLLAWLQDLDWTAHQTGPDVLYQAFRVLRHAASQLAREQSRLGTPAVSAAFGIHGAAIYVAAPEGWEPRAAVETFERRLIRALPIAQSHLKMGLANASTLGRISADDIERALHSAYRQGVRAQAGPGAVRHNLAGLIAARDLRILYQPIVSLRDGSVFGHEALTRGPAGSPLEYPDRLFPVAEREGLLLPLERVCRELAIEGFASAVDSGKLFLNMNPRILQDEAFQAGLTLRLIREMGLPASQVVFEITERQAVTDFRAFREALEHYRRQGFRIAVDDAGAGYSSLQAIMELHPDIIKADMSIIRGINHSAVQRSLFAALVEVAGTMGSQILAEGIETRGELAAVMRLGGDLGQGFFLGRPGPIGAPLIAEVQRTVKSLHRPRLRQPGLMLGDIAERTSVLSLGATGQEAAALFNANEQLDSCPVVEDGSVVGLVMRGAFFQALRQPFGVSLYYDRPLSLLMDGHPLVLDSATSLEDAAAAAAARPSHQLYDHIVVANGPSYMGVVSIRVLLESMSEARRHGSRAGSGSTVPDQWQTPGARAAGRV